MITALKFALSQMMAGFFATLGSFLFLLLLAICGSLFLRGRSAAPLVTKKGHPPELIRAVEKLRESVLERENYEMAGRVDALLLAMNKGAGHTLLLDFDVQSKTEMVFQTSEGSTEETRMRIETFYVVTPKL